MRQAGHMSYARHWLRLVSCPQPGCLVGAGGGDEGTVETERHRLHCASVAGGVRTRREGACTGTALRLPT
jgi:hypothetical protein